MFVTHWDTRQSKRQNAATEAQSWTKVGAWSRYLTGAELSALSLEAAYFIASR
jgi:hypothetical protein